MLLGNVENSVQYHTSTVYPELGRVCAEIFIEEYLDTSPLEDG
jgi:hypothetical protein